MPISIQTKNPMFGVLQPFSSRSCIVLSFKSDAIKKHDLFFVIVVLCQRISVFSCAYHLERTVGWLPCFSCLVFLSISFPLKNIMCLSDAPCFVPRLEFFLMTKLGIEIKLQLAFWNCNESSRFPNKNCNQDIKFLQNSRKVRRSLFGHVVE